MIGDFTLAVHIVAGAAGLAVGPFAIRDAARGARGRAGDVYHWLVALACLSAGALALLDLARLWFFVLIAAASYAFALRAFLASRRRPDDMRDAQLRGYGGAYIALTTAVFVVSLASVPVLWVLPAAVGVPALHVVAHRRQVAT